MSWFCPPPRSRAPARQPADLALAALADLLFIRSFAVAPQWRGATLDQIECKPIASSPPREVGR